MPDILTRDEFLAHFVPVRDRMEELVALQRAANGRAAKVETRLAVLEDRSPHRSSLITGGASAAGIGGLAAIAKLLGFFP
tara:strand:+ start:1079 stop:1318 length:240 start_codon:yes stop_codon:yes gene_type:complete